MRKLEFKSFDSFTSSAKSYTDKTINTIDDAKAAGTQLIKNLGFQEKEVTAWAKHGGAYYKVDNAREQLTPGFYVATLTMAGPAFIPFSVANDQILELPDQKTSLIVDKGNEFWELEETFAKLNFLHKRGILLDGQVGTGKSVIAFKLGRNLIQKHAGVILYPTNPYALAYCAADFREVQPSTKLMCTIEDIDEVCYGYGEKMITSFLDGEFQVNNILSIATTNNIKGLTKRLTARPSRFDVKETIGVMSKEARKSFLDQKATTLTEEQKVLWVEKTDDFTIPALKELMILVLAYCYPLEDSIANIRKHFVSNTPDV